jgi:hypothetical protein
VTTELMVRYVERRPFIPFEIITVDGRVIPFPHSDFGSLERYAASIIIFDATGRAEIIDVSLIVSMRLLEPLPDDVEPDGDKSEKE